LPLIMPLFVVVDMYGGSSGIQSFLRYQLTTTREFNAIKSEDLSMVN
jgi:hypothetical protein